MVPGREDDEMSKQKKQATGGKATTGKVPEKKPTSTKRKSQPKKTPSVLDAHKARAADDLVVFAIRVTEAERDLIHSAAGPGKASRFVRAVSIAAAKGDEGMLREILKERHTTSA
jgi:hypothetical protein